MKSKHVHNFSASSALTYYCKECKIWWTDEEAMASLRKENKRLYESVLKLAAALSEIDYILGEPNEMHVSPYDVHCDEQLVIKGVQALRERAVDLAKVLTGPAEDDDPRDGCAYSEEAKAALARWQEYTNGNAATV